MNKSIPPISDEHLVAYLDGELDATAKSHIEGQLAENADLRHRLAHFEQSWNLLDELPATEVEDEFAQTTVTLVAASLPQKKPRSRWIPWVIAVAIGFLLAAVPLRINRQRRLQDLPVIQNMELYRVAESVDFLEMLEAEGLFVEDVDDVL